MSRLSLARVAALVVVALGLAGAGPATTASSGAGSGPLLGLVGDAARFETLTGQHSQVEQAFLNWGQGDTWGTPFLPLFASLGTVPMVHLGTEAQHGGEAISPGEIAAGKGDAYLLAFNHAISSWGQAIYVRPMAEMNNDANPYAGFTAGGSPKGSAHSPAAYRKAFDRIYLILHGGSVASVNADLAALGLPTLPSGSEIEPNPFPRLRVVWSPLASSAPPIPANAAQEYYPGARYVDVEAGDIFDEQLTDTAPWSGLESLYSDARARGKPFAVPEWGLLGVDDPAFVRHMCAFLSTHTATEVAVFYEGDVRSREDLATKPGSERAYRACVPPLAGPLPSWVVPAARALALSITPSPPSGAAPLAAQLAIQAKLTVPIAGWDLLFGDGSSLAGGGAPPASIEHDYVAAGDYQPLLFVFRSPPFEPGQTPFVATASVAVGATPNVLLDLVQIRGPGPLALSFHTEIHLPAPPASWSIDWGDGRGETGTGAPPTFDGHTYDQAGTYDVLLLVTDSSGHQFGALASVTAGSPSPPPPPPSTSTSTTTTPVGTSPPATGTSTGKVLIGGRPYLGGTIPPGATVDVTHGTIHVTTITGNVNLYGAGTPSEFKLLNGTDGGKRVVLIELVGGNFAACGTIKGTRHTAGLAKTTPKNKTIRQLWGSGKGLFETRGRYASAAVRGTNWLTRDLCDGTLVIVRQGTVAVYDLKTHKTVLVHAGHSYFVP